MLDVNIGVIVIAITALGYVSNFLNWRFLDYAPIRALYYVGALVHETSHAIACILTGARIEQFTVFSNQPQVVHRKSRLPILGELIISAAPIAGGLLFLFLVNRYALGSYFTVPSFGAVYGWKIFLLVPFGLLSQINLLQWQSWVMIFLSFNSGAMLGPSMQDLKNVWPMLIVLLFFQSPTITEFGAATIIMIIVNIMIQAIAIIGVQITKHLIGNKI